MAFKLELVRGYQKFEKISNEFVAQKITKFKKKKDNRNYIK